MLAAPALGVGVNMFLGADGVSSNGFGTGGAFTTISNPNGNQYAVTKSLEAHVKIPAGSQGNAFARFSGSNTYTTTKSLNGNSYYLQAGYQNAVVNAGARKTVKQGVATSDAIVAAYASVDNNNLPYPMSGCKKNYLDGWAKIYADTSSTTTGDTYAFATGNAFYTAREICPSCPTPVKEVSGRINGTADVESINKECASCPTCVPPAPTGTKKGTALIYTTSNANDWKSYSYSQLYTDVSANRGSNSGFSGVNATVGGITAPANPLNIVGTAQASSYAVDGSSPAGTPSTFNDANAKSFVRNRIFSYATTYAIGDKANAKTYMTSKAWHNLDNNLDYEKAYNQLTSEAKVTRVDFNYLTPAVASNLAGADAARFFARAQDNNDPNKYAVESANLGRMLTRAQLLTPSTVSATKNLELTAIQNSGALTAKISDVSKANGAITGDAADRVDVEQSFANLFAEARQSPTNFVGEFKRAQVATVNVDLAVPGDGSDGPQVHTFTGATTAPVVNAPVETFSDGSATTGIVTDDFKLTA